MANEMVLAIQSTTTGETIDVAYLVESLSYETQRVGKPSSINFTLLKLKEEKISIDEGSIVSFIYNDAKIFLGYVFSIEENENKITVTAYDQIRYLLNKDTFVFKGLRADQILEQIANTFELQTSELINTGYAIPSLIEDNQTLLDMILKALDLTLINTGELFYLYDDYGLLTIKNIKDSILNLMLGDESLLTSYTYKRSIDDEVYNQIKLVKNNKTTGKRDVYFVFDSNTINKWGILQYFETVNENLNDVQVKELANTLISERNRPKQTLTLDCLGDFRIKAGNVIYVLINGANIKQRMLVESITHNLSTIHTMSLELKVV